MLRIPAMKSDEVCSTFTLGVLTLTCFDLLLRTSHTHIHRDHWHKGESLDRGYRCTATAVPLLYRILILYAERLLFQKQSIALHSRFVRL